MLSNTLLLLSSFLLGAQAFTIPVDTPEGTYAVRRNIDGTYEHIQLARAPVAEIDLEVRNVTIEARSPTTYCGCGQGMNHGDCDAAVADLENQAGTWGI